MSDLNSISLFQQTTINNPVGIFGYTITGFDILYICRNDSLTNKGAIYTCNADGTNDLNQVSPINIEKPLFISRIFANKVYNAVSNGTDTIIYYNDWTNIKTLTGQKQKMVVADLNDGTVTLFTTTDNVINRWDCNNNNLFTQIGTSLTTGKTNIIGLAFDETNKILYFTYRGSGLNTSGGIASLSGIGTSNTIKDLITGLNGNSNTGIYDLAYYNNNIYAIIRGDFNINNGQLIKVDTTNTQVNSWTSSTTNINNDWNSITYGNNLFVAVSSTGTGNRVTTSSNGITWISRTSEADNDWTSVTYGNGIFVAVANSGTGNRVMTSSNGTSWPISATDGLDFAWSSVAYGGNINDIGLFVAVSLDGYVMTMTYDGADFNCTLSTSTVPNSYSWSSVTFGNGLFVAVSSDGKVMYSSDGNAWTLSTSTEPNNHSWTSVTYGNGLFVAVSSDGKVMYSSNGSTWLISSSSVPNNRSWTSVTYGNGLFVAVANSGTGNRVMISQDGEDWTSQKSASDNDWTSVTYGNGLFVAVSNSGTDNRSMYSFIGTQTILANNLYNPRGITYLNNNLYITSFNTNIIYKYSLTDNQLSIINFSLKNMFGLIQPLNDDYLYSTNFSTTGIGSIAKLNKSSSATKINESILYNGLNNPIGVCFYNDYFYVTNQGTPGTVTKISLTGEVTTIASGITNAYGIASNNAGLLFVSSNITNGSISKIDLNNLNTVTPFISGLTNGSVYNITIDNTNTYLLVCRFSTFLNSNLLIYNISDGSLYATRTTMSNPISVVCDNFNRIYVLCQKGKSLIMFENVNATTYTVITSGLNTPRGITLDYNKEIFYITDSLSSSTINAIPGAQVGQQIYQTTKKINYLTANSTIDKIDTDPNFTFTPTSNSNGDITFESSNESVAKIINPQSDSCTIQIMGVGQCTITSTQSATPNYMGGTFVTTLNVVASTITTILSNFYPLGIEKILGDAPFILNAPTSNNPVDTFTYESSNTDIASINSNIVSIKNIGQVTITCTQSASSNYTSASISTTLTIITPSIDNPPVITSSEGVESFLDLPGAPIVSITESIVVTNDLVNTTDTSKSLFNKSEETISITKST